MKEILLAALGVLGVAIPSVIQLMTGESRRVSNMRATVKLINELPPDATFDPTRDWLGKSLRQESSLDTGSHKGFMVVGGIVIAACLASTFLVMQPPGSGPTESEWRSFFILLSVVLYVVGAAVFVHGVHLLGRQLHLFSRHDGATP